MTSQHRSPFHAFARTLAIAVALAPLAASGTGCADQAAPPKAPPTLSQGDVKPQEAEPAPLPSSNAPPPGVDASVTTPSGLHVSDAIARACNLTQEKAKTKFDFDSSEVQAEDKELLGKLATCLTEGGLKGRTVSLIGRADPRGENEYNMSLGAHRANAVKTYMGGLGVAKQHLRTTSRGELDAQGKDEATWAEDRRVDIELAD
jgi:peptidoglycan-associated lipoprotein